MSDEQPHNDEQRDDLPLPDVNRAWQKMEVLLDEDDRRRRVLPWWVWRMAAPGLLLLGLAVGGWLWLHSHSTGSETARTSGDRPKKEEKGTGKIAANPAGKEAWQTGNGRKPVAPADRTRQTVPEGVPVQKDEPPTENIIANLKTSPNHNPSSMPERSGRPTANAAVLSLEKQKTEKQRQKERRPQTALPSLPLKKGDDKKGGQEAAAKKETPVDLRTETRRKDSLQKPITLTKDGIAVAKDSAKSPSAPGVQTKEKNAKKKDRPALVFSAGIGFQQAIALHDGPSPVTDSGSSKHYFFDYFPSVYLKVQRGRWAVQAEAHYSVPQSVPKLAFSQKTTIDAGSMTTKTERQMVQKIYYHQLPVSINYQLLPQWSMGLGGVYNILAGAVAQKEVVSRYAPTGAETVSKNTEPIRGYKDSFLYKTTAGLSIQTDYHWKRFSLGLRYLHNLQPFIKYTKPDGTVLDKKNNALQAILRFQLWRSK